MNIICSPTVHVLASPVFHEHPKYKIPSDGDDITKICSFAAKNCYDSFGEDGRSNTDNQLRVLDHGHGSVLEHATIVLLIEGISRGLTLEMNRHRHFGISQRSTRYTAEEDASIVLEPYFASLYKKHGMYFDSDISAYAFDPLILNSPKLNSPNLNSSYLTEVSERELLLSNIYAIEKSFEEYSKQINCLTRLNPLNLSGFELRKWARGKARNILPHCLETKVVYSGNIRAWRWFIESRSNRHAEAEIRRLATYVKDALTEKAPLYFQDYKKTIYDSIPEWTTEHRKV